MIGRASAANANVAIKAKQIAHRHQVANPGARWVPTFTSANCIVT